MSDDNDDDMPAIDDLVTVDDLKDFREEIQSEFESEPVDVDPADIDVTDQLQDEIDSFVDRKGAAEVADQRVINNLDHLINEDCDTEACEHKRDGLAELVAERLGLDADMNAGDGEADEADAEEAEDAETTETGGEGSHRGGQPDGDADAEPEADAETEETPDDDGEEVETNTFGEPVW